MKTTGQLFVKNTASLPVGNRKKQLLKPKICEYIQQQVVLVIVWRFLYAATCVCQSVSHFGRKRNSILSVKVLIINGVLVLF